MATRSTAKAKFECDVNERGRERRDVFTDAGSNANAYTLCSVDAVFVFFFFFVIASTLAFSHSH